MTDPRLWVCQLSCVQHLNAEKNTFRFSSVKIQKHSSVLFSFPQGFPIRCLCASDALCYTVCQCTKTQKHNPCSVVSARPDTPCPQTHSPSAFCGCSRTEWSRGRLAE